MRKTTGFAATLAAAGLVAAGFMGPASAAPSNKGTTYIVPEFGAEVARPGYFVDGRGAAFGIVGNPSDGTIEHVGGVYVQGANGLLKIRNFTIDTLDGTVSGIVNGKRADLFTITSASMVDGDIIASLAFTEAASMAVAGDDRLINLPAGTAVVDLP